MSKAEGTKGQVGVSIGEAIGTSVSGEIIDPCEYSASAATEHDVAVQPNPNQPVLLEDECIPGVTRVYGKQYSVGASQAGVTGVILTLVTATGATVIEMRDKYIAHGKLCTR